MRIPFFRLKLTEAEMEAVRDVLKSGWVTTGPKTAEFEKKIKNIVKAKYAIAVSSATAGLHLALAARGIGPGDEVITTPFTMAATIEAILYTGARPILADVEPRTLNIDPARIRARISSRTRAVIPVDIAGWPCDYGALKSIARKHRLLLLEDAAHSLGAIYKGKPIGSVSDVTVFSFYSTKNITTGEGGMAVTDNKRLGDRIRHLSLHGMTSSGWKRHSGGAWKYDITDLGYKYNMSDLAAGLGLGQLQRFDTLQKRRLQLAERYMNQLQDLSEYIELPSIDNSCRHAWHLFIIKIDSPRWKIGRDRLIDELQKKGVGCGVHFIPIYRFSYFQKALAINPAAAECEFVCCENNYRRVISLPFYPDLSFAEVDHVCDVLHSLVGKFKK
jgi:dTDP-4-amino-4,6-dideoxygalactose transaminase